MKGKTGIILLAVVIAGLCLWHLSFTVVSYNARKDAESYATFAAESFEGDSKDSVYKIAKNEYLDSIWDQKAYFDYTMKDVKERDLNLGLDLQGGMHITLSVAREEIILDRCINKEDENFKKALATATAISKKEHSHITDLFRAEYAKLVGADKMWVLFQGEKNASVKANATDEEVVVYLDSQISGALDKTMTILRNRVDEFGASQPIIRSIEATGRIEIELPGVDDQERIMKKLKSVAQLQFLEMWGPQQGANFMMAVNQYLISIGEKQIKVAQDEIDVESDSATISEDGEVEDDLFENNDTDESEEIASADSVELDADSLALAEAAQDSISEVGAPIANYFASTGDGRWFVTRDKLAKALALLERQEVKDLIMPGMKVMRGKMSDQGFAEIHFVKLGDVYEPQITGDNVADAQGIIDINQQTGGTEFVVKISLDGDGAIEMEKMSEKLVQNNEPFAICLDNVVQQVLTYREVIKTGNGQISGQESLQAAQDLAGILRAGSLEASTNVERVVTVGPSLGAEAVDRGLLSLIAGLVLVIIFMMAYYSGGGLVANIALVFNLFLILGIFAMPMFEAALTLPGIAGIVLTIGMSIDANVLIFERIKEEMSNGKTLMNAISEGYGKAFWTIFDANATTLATAFILMSFGTGLVKGFAITLMIGIFCSFFSAVFITRIIIEAMAKKRGKMSFATPFSKNILSKVNRDFIGKRKMAYTFSLVVIVAGVIVMFTKGMNMGVSFSGGYSYVAKFDESVAASDVKGSLLSVMKDASVDVKAFDGDDQVKITTSYLMKSDVEDKDEKVMAAVLEGLQGYSNPRILEASSVSPTIAKDIKSSSLVSMILSLIVIFFYILVRFRKAQFSLGALIALVHDVLFVLSIFAITGLLGLSFEIDEVFIAAVLTIVGYSINDTVVVFDRVREYLSLKKGDNDVDADTLNQSVNSTMSRTIMTSVTTLIVILVLLIFGGEALRGFSFALFIGVMIGTYSSIFIATPIVLDSTLAKNKFDKEKK